MKKRFRVLDIFRGLFAFCVVLYHMAYYTQSPVLHNSFVSNSFLFVDFFFMLSGFVIAYNYDNIESLAAVKKFFSRRFFRLYPLHLLMLLVFLMYEPLRHALSHHAALAGGVEEKNTLVSFFSSLFMINSIKLPGVTSLSWNYPSWSISAEMISYLLFALLMLGIFKARLKKYRLLFSAGLVFLSFFLFQQVQHNLFIYKTYDLGFLRGILGFSAGVLCFDIYKRLRLDNLKLPLTMASILETIAIAGILAVVINAKLIVNYNCEYITTMVFFAAILIFSLEAGLISNSLTSVRLLQNAGSYSYSIYMTHPIVNIVFNIVFFRIVKLPTSAYAFLFVLDLAAVYLVSSFTFHQVELRFYNRDKKAVRKKKVSEEVAVVSEKLRPHVREAPAG